MNIIDKIKVFFKTKALVDYITKNATKEIKMAETGVVKPSWQSGSFWFVVASQAIPVILLLWGLIPPAVVIQIMAVGGIIASLMALIRAFIVTSVSKKDDEAFNKWLAIIKPLLDKVNIKIDPIEIPAETPVEPPK